MSNTPLIVAIDGPAGAGKSAVARRVARKFDFTYLDTGAMYRALAWKVVQCGMDKLQEAELTSLAEASFIKLSNLDSQLRQTVQIDGNDVTSLIRTPKISQLTSQISSMPGVRKVMVAQQRQLAANATRGVVLEGRDIGTVVFPDAHVKIFLTASPEERARRRHRELEAKGELATFSSVLEAQLERDARDANRSASPLREADDAHVLISDGLSIDEVVEQIATICRRAPGHVV